MFSQTRTNLSEEDFIRRKLSDTGKSAFSKYRELMVGERSYVYLFFYEAITSLLGPLPGAIGLFLRRLFYPYLFRDIGPGAIFGRNVIVRHPHKMRIGAHLVLDDNCLLDARGCDEAGFVIGDDVIINRGCELQSKVGPLKIGSNCDIGSHSLIASQGGVIIHDGVGIGGGCKISGGYFDLIETPGEHTPYVRHTRGPIVIERNCLLGMGVTVLDGVTIGESCMVGAGSVILKDLPRESIASPRPAMVLPARLTPAS